MKIHYKTDKDKQKRYEEHVRQMTATVKERYGKGFDDSVHPIMIEQFVRSVIRADDLEERIDNGEAEKSLYEMLKAERSVQKDILDRLKLTVRGIVGDTRSFKKERTSDFVEFFQKKFNVLVEDNPDETDSDNV